MAIGLSLLSVADTDEYKDDRASTKHASEGTSTVFNERFISVPLKVRFTLPTMFLV